MTEGQLLKELERCDEEIARCLKETETDDRPEGPLLGYRDWNVERKLILKELENMASRTFETGATRNSKLGKLEYKGFNCPLVMKRYAQYMDSHRMQEDGTERAADNWKKGIPTAEYTDSMFRHFMDLYLWELGYPEECTADIEDILCAIIFNANGYLHEVLKTNKENEFFGEPFEEPKGPIPEVISPAKPEEFSEDFQFANTTHSVSLENQGKSGPPGLTKLVEKFWPRKR